MQVACLDLQEKLKKLEAQVFLEEKIDIIEIEELPKEFNCDKYLELIKLQLATMRHRLWKVISQTGGKSDDPEVKAKQKELFLEVVSQKLEI